MKRRLQFSLIILIFISIGVFYFKYFRENIHLETKKKVDLSEINLEKTDTILNLEYEINIDQGNYYKIVSESTKVINDNVELLEMKKVRGIYINELNNTLIITSDNAIYNIHNHQTNFRKNVKIEYLDNIITGDNLILDFKKKEITILDNIKYDGIDANLIADIIKIDLITKNIKISMKMPNKKVSVNLKN